MRLVKVWDDRRGYRRAEWFGIKWADLAVSDAIRRMVVPHLSRAWAMGPLRALADR
ncbi:MAG TPA: hypothetical protein VNJ03_09630 [Vicinamibacterales bacterium]|nr:hypothetical protein [Vicinamibacterales bacterium]